MRGIEAETGYANGQKMAIKKEVEFAFLRTHQEFWARPTIYTGPFLLIFQLTKLRGLKTWR